MNPKMKIAMLVMGSLALAATAQDRPTKAQSTQSAQTQPAQAQGEPLRREPPPQAYEDCKGRKAGEAIQHTTREGKVAATCQESPKGLVARPNQPPPSAQGGPSK
jgi:hypothetical protein